MSRSLLLLLTSGLLACTAETSSPAIADRFEVVQGGAQTGSPGRPLDTLVVLRLLDDRGAPMAGVPVTWQTTDGSGEVDSTSSTTGPDGLAVARWTLGGATGDQHLIALSALGQRSEIVAISSAFVATAVDAGFSYACALDPAGAAWCWGFQYGNGVTLDSAGHLGQSDRPIPVAGGHTFVELGVGDQYACGRTAVGEVWCWGTSRYGEIGDAHATPGSSIPVRVAGIPSMGSRTTGATHVCALAAADSTAWCWGDNDKGATTGTPGISGPNQVSTFYHFRTLAAGWNFTCGVTDAGETRCWGEGTFGKNGTYDNLLGVGPPVAGLPSAPVRLTLGDYTACAEFADGPPRCWGWNQGGVVDPEAPWESDTAIPYSIPTARSVSVGAYYIAAARMGGAVWFTGLTGSAPDPFVFGDDAFLQIAADDSFCGIRRDGAVVCSADMFTGAWDGLPPFGGPAKVVPAP